MLQYKLKHLCSCIIASLTSFGLFSISSRAEAAQQLGKDFTYAQPGDYFTYNFASNTTITGEYEQNSACVWDGNGTFEDAHIKTVTYRSGQTGEVGSGVMPSCHIVCEDGYVLGSATSVDASGVYTAPSGSGSTITSEMATSEVRYSMACYEPMTPTCATVANASSKLSDLVTGQGYTCSWTCNAGYSVGGGTNTTSSINASEYKAEGIISAPAGKSCSARTYSVTFNCGDKGTYGNTSNHTKTVTATYGQKFTIPTDATCTREGYNFSGWTRVQ